MTPLRLAIIPLALFMSACTITGPADDGFENSLESIDIGKLQTNELLDRVLKQATGSAGSAVQNTNQ